MIANYLLVKTPENLQVRNKEIFINIYYWLKQINDPDEDLMPTQKKEKALLSNDISSSITSSNNFKQSCQNIIKLLTPIINSPISENFGSPSAPPIMQAIVATEVQVVKNLDEKFTSDTPVARAIQIP